MQCEVEVRMTGQSRIILADDDPIMREMASARLSAVGYCVTAVENGAQALKALKTDGADLVISDLDMPVMTGFELTENIRADRQIDQTPVIVITASDHAQAVDDAFAAGATSFLAKPINWTLFSQAVMFVLRASENQKALVIARDQAEAGAKFKDGLMSVMSHELRTPLNAIIGFGQLLAEQFAQEDNNPNKEYANYIVDGGKRLLNSVSDMLLASDACSGPITINETDNAIGDLIKIVMTDIAPAAKTADAVISVKLQDPGLELCCDQQLVTRALYKIIDNAIKFSPRGVKVIIGAALTRNGDLAILVKDNGPGISPDKLSEISLPFAQSDMSIRRSKEGLGLGLPLAQTIAHAHDATFRLDSTLGEGTRALLVFPASRVNPHKRARTKNAA